MSNSNSRTNHSIDIYSTVEKIATYLQNCSNAILDLQVFLNGIEIYIRLLEKTRKKFNLIGHKELVWKHIIDCIAPLDIVKELVLQYRNKNQVPSNESIVFTDLGSGAGLPGMVMALAFSCAKIPSTWYLLEQSQKKSNFLQEALTSVIPYLSNTKLFVVPKTLKEWTPAPKIHFLTFRAFKPFKDIFSPLQTLAPDAELLMYKGRLITIQEEISPWASENNLQEVFSFENKQRSQLLSSAQPLAKDNSHLFKKDVIRINAVYPLHHDEEKERHLVHASWSNA